MAAGAGKPIASASNKVGVVQIAVLGIFSLVIIELGCNGMNCCWGWCTRLRLMLQSIHNRLLIFRIYLPCALRSLSGRPARIGWILLISQAIQR
jgi:hypothetical protein